MYKTRGLEHIATITELRMDASTLLNTVHQDGSTVLIQKNGEPHAVLMSPEAYERLVNGEEEA